MGHSCAWILLLAGAASAQAFPHRQHVAGGPATNLVTGDIDGDGKVDLVTSGFQSTTSLTRGVGNGDFLPAETLPLPSSMRNVALGDLDGDGWLDLAAAPQTCCTVSVSFALGGGAFAAPVAVPAGCKPRWLEIADVDADSALDLVVVGDAQGTGTGVVVVLRGDGAGAFSAPITTPVQFEPVTFVTAYLDDDEHLDLVLAHDQNDLGLTVALGNGTGAFPTVLAQAPGFEFDDLVAFDVNGDGDTDVVAATGSGPARLLLGNGSGQLAHGGSVPSEQANVSGLRHGDVDGDGTGDLVARTTGEVYQVSYGLAGGGLEPFELLHVGLNARDSAVADLDGDGLTDFIGQQLMSSGVGGATVLRGDGTRDFSSGLIDPPSISDGRQVALGDLDQDGDLDLVASEFILISVTMSTGPGTFGPAGVDFGDGSAGYIDELWLTDLDEDSDLDMLTIHQGAGLGVRFNDGRGAFGPLLEFATPMATSGDAVLGDFDGDEHMDVVRLGATATHFVVVAMLGDGDGGFTLGPTTTLEPFTPTFMDLSRVTADLDLDGALDLLQIRQGAIDEARLWLGNGDGSFSAGASIPVPDAIWAAHPADLDGSGKPELLIGTVPSGSLTKARVSVYAADGLGGYALVDDELLDVTGAGLLAVGDVSGDARPDAVVAHGSGSLSVLTGDGAGGLHASRSYALLPQVRDMALGDVDADGLADAVMVNAAFGAEIRLNLGVPPAFAVYGMGLGGKSGVPLLTGTGQPLAGAPFALELASAKPLAPAFLVIGFSNLSAPLLGGVLVPAPDVILGGLLTDSAGEFTLGGPWPAGVPAGLTLYVQYWIQDASGPKDFTASNGLMTVTSG